MLTTYIKNTHGLVKKPFDICRKIGVTLDDKDREKFSEMNVFDEGRRDEVGGG